MGILLSFIIVAFGQPAWIGPLGLVAAVCGYALFWRAMLRAKRRFLLAFLWFTAVQLVQLSWMTSDEYQGIYTWFFWALLSLGMGTQFGLISLLVKEKMEILHLLAVPAAWTIMEWLRLYFLAGMTWNPVGLALTSWSVPRQMVSLVGIYGLSFWVILVNVLLLQKKWKPLIAAALFPYFFGFAHLAYHSHFMKKEETQLSILLVQPGICPGERSGVGCGVQGMIDPLAQWQSLLKLVAPYKQQNLDLVVFPEGLVPFEAHRPVYYKALSNANFCQSIANDLDADVIAGLDLRRGDAVYNAALFFQPGQQDLTEWYGKRVLMPIVEDISNPFLRPIAKFYGVAGGFTKGEKVRLFPSKVPLACSICYEETFSQITRETKKEGAELLVNLTNDGWYPRSRLPEQHFYHGRLRSLENGIPLVRACSIGVTAAVDSLGRTVAQIESGRVPGALHALLSPYHYKTLYSLTGDGLALGSSFLIFFLFLRKQN